MAEAKLSKWALLSAFTAFICRMFLFPLVGSFFAVISILLSAFALMKLNQGDLSQNKTKIIIAITISIVIIILDLFSILSM